MGALECVSSMKVAESKSDFIQGFWDCGSGQLLSQVGWIQNPRDTNSGRFCILTTLWVLWSVTDLLEAELQEGLTYTKRFEETCVWGWEH
jgi:hypothetical protein